MPRIPVPGTPIAGLTLAVLVLATAPVHAQTVTGRLFETGTTTPIEGATVYLLDEDSNQIDAAETDDEGRFTLEAPDPGAFYLRAEMTGYRTKTDGVLELGEGGEISIVFYLMPQPIELADSLLAIGERVDPIAAARTRFLEGQGFFERLDEGFGEFITPEEIEERHPTTARDLFWKARGVKVERMTGTDGYILPGGQRYLGEVVMLSGGRNPTVFIDGRRVWPPASSIRSGCTTAGSGLRPRSSPQGQSESSGTAAPFPVDNFLDVTAIRAVEIYDGPSEVPAQYNVAGASCGVVLIWTG